MDIYGAEFNLGIQFGDDGDWHESIPVHSLEVTGGAGGAVRFPLQVQDAGNLMFEKLDQARALKNIILYVAFEKTPFGGKQTRQYIGIVDSFYHQLHKDPTLPPNAVGRLLLRAGEPRFNIELRGSITFKQSPYIVERRSKLLKLELNLPNPTVRRVAHW